MLNPSSKKTSTTRHQYRVTSFAERLASTMNFAEESNSNMLRDTDPNHTKPSTSNSSETLPPIVSSKSNSCTTVSSKSQDIHVEINTLSSSDVQESTHQNRIYIVGGQQCKGLATNLIISRQDTKLPNIVCY